VTTGEALALLKYQIKTTYPNGAFLRLSTITRAWDPGQGHWEVNRLGAKLGFNPQTGGGKKEWKEFFIHVRFRQSI